MFLAANNPIPILPLTTEAQSMLNPRPAEGPYIPYDFSQMALYDVVAYTINNGGSVMLGSCLFFFVVQFLSHYVLAAIFGDAYAKKRTLAQRREDCIRVCSIVNGLIAVPSALMFFRAFVDHGYQIHSYHYQPLAGYDFNRGFITGYFIWDIIVCVRFNWGFLWTTHGIFSFLGCFLLNFPVSDHIGCYFTGMFELTNGLLHTSVLLRNYKMMPTIATILEYTFALFYLLIRVIGGTYCALTWMGDMYAAWPKLHSHIGVGFIWFSVSTIMILQYVWFWEIVQHALGLKKRDPDALEGSPASSPTDSNSSQKAKEKVMADSAAASSPVTKRKSVRKEE